jgi:hypothetical protein
MPKARTGFTQKLQAIKNPKEADFTWGFSVSVVPRDGIEPPTQGNDSKPA